MITYIYLIELGNNQVYVGKTKEPKNRYKNHKVKFGKNIKISIIDQVNSLNKKQWKPIETAWIWSFISWGFDVINKNDGGGGPVFHKKNSRKKMSKSQQNKGSKPVIQYDLNGNFIKRWNTISLAHKTLNIKQGITNVCNKKRKTAGGFIWRYENDTDLTTTPHKSGKIVEQYNKQGELINTFTSASEAIRLTQIKGILNVLNNIAKTAGGYYFKYKTTCQ